MASLGKKLTRKARARRATTTAPLEAELRELRRLLEVGDNRAASARFDRIAVREELARSGTEGEHPGLTTVLRHALAATFQEPGHPPERLAHVPGESLWHGATKLFSGNTLRVLYFEDLDRGFCEVIDLDAGKKRRLPLRLRVR